MENSCLLQIGAQTIFRFTQSMQPVAQRNCDPDGSQLCARIPFSRDLLSYFEKLMTFQNDTDAQESTAGQEETSPLSRTNAGDKRQVLFRQKAKLWATNLFIGFHLLAITCWCLPIDTPLLPLCRSIVRPYFLWAELFQSWDMFAPVPKGANTYLEAELRYKDGSRKTWKYPRMEEMSIREKLFRERYRKFADNLERGELDDLLPDAARYIARMNSSPGNPVKTVILIQRYSFIVPHSDGTYVPEPWQSHVLLGYGVRPEDLK